MYTQARQFTKESSHDVFVIGLLKNGGLDTAASDLNEMLNGQIEELKKQGLLSSDKGELRSFYTFGQAKTATVYTIGLGDKKEVDAEVIRELAGKLGKKLKEDRVTDVAISLDAFLAADQTDASDIAFLIGEGLGLSTYEVVDYKEKSNKPEKHLEAVTLYTEASDDVAQSAVEGKAYAEGTNYARTLVNTPANLLTPTDLAEEAHKLSERYGFKLEVLEEEDMKRLGMGALLAVTAGSDQPAKMIVLTYQGTDKWENAIGLVGKGMTFDAGGVSLKPALGMHEMKMDMGGAGAVLGAMESIGQLKPAVNIVAVIPSAENMINGSALKPGDVIRAMTGKTIEIRNTDAEGRLILADGVAYARQLGVDYLVDVATLTGAVVVALGDYTTGAITNNDEWMQKVTEASETAGEWIWQLPSHKPYQKMLQTSNVADLNNAPGRAGGSITAGLFIGEFVENTPWVHLDIAGTAWQDKPSTNGPAGATGVMARTLTRLVVSHT
ncbi:leucyl aminopeptidase [Alkalicoccobacillus murimartini]|uniref:Probable cytosol aminopeptidase n=1 Tax=Alkalicoccobacillus murimartini TaxID=171685 RepID=A0ABT9YFF7_9BACI|nr:leucyl aminopeptidase [Alkalicoccobacillus murimartini]MDQ0206575.1 leucyl aminopeptidase [Alkalicoccobacillus murimartini]